MKNRFVYCIALLCLLTACNKLEVEPVAFNVTVENNTYNLGDTVTFNFTGNPDYLVFYSGEIGSKYEFINRKAEIGEPLMNFTSLKTGNSLAKIELFISNDFAGIYDKETVEKATWHNLSDKAVFSSGADNTPSGNVSLKEYYNANQPLYLAFVSSKPEDNLSRVFTHSIKTLNINNVLSDGTVHNVNPATNFQGWKNVDFSLNTALWTVNGSNQLTINTVTANNTLENEDWAISGPIDLGKAIPDKAKPIKSIAMVMPTKYSHVFAAKGTYKVSFVAYNQTSENKKEVIKEITIQIN